MTRFQTIVGQFLLKDFTMLKVMVTAIVVGGAGIYGLRAMGVEVALHVKSAVLAMNIVGGLIFGVGMAALGYCPGTGVAALGDGSRHAIPGVLGMIAGAAVYAEIPPWFGRTLGGGDLGKITFMSETGLAPWWFIAGIVVAAIVGFRVLEKIERSPRGSATSATRP